jgi:5'(3')-deoxyribonucleotidase
MRKVVYVDMDNVLVDFQSSFQYLDSELMAQYKNDLDDIPGVFSLMKPMTDAIEAYKAIAEKYDTYVLSTAPWDNPTAWSDKLLWIQKHLGEHAYKRLILSHNKHLNAGDYLIDDRTKNGADRFSGEHIHFGTADFPDWRKVCEYLEVSI